MIREMGIAAAVMIASQLTGAGARAVPTTETQHKHVLPLGNSAEPTGPKVALHFHHAHHLKRRVIVATHAEPPAAEPEPDSLGPVLSPLPEASLTAQERRVGEIAVRGGDSTFLMVDKAVGRILLFEDGEPVFMGHALTGASTSDRMPAHETGEAFAKLDALADKVTPAGRFTVTRGFEKGYGPLLDIKEIQGKDWAIAIHKVFLGFPAENRAERLQSPRSDDKNITFGCINVTPEAIKLILRELPEQGATPLYVLPRDDTQTAAYFAPRTS
jgi:hypothetical protein